MSTSAEIQTSVQKYLDEIALSAIIARNEGVDKTQVSKLIEMLESVDSYTLQLHIVRQIARGEWSKSSGARLVNLIEKIRNELKNEVNVKKALHQVLGYFKWFYESFEVNKNITNILRNRISNWDQLVRNPQIPPHQGFANLYIRSLLGLT